MDDLHDNCFAFPYRRKYPIHTKEAALNSFQEFCNDKKAFPAAVLPEIEENFKKAAAYHEIELKPLEKQASATKETLKFDTGTDIPLVMSKISSSEDISKAVSFILEKRADVSRGMLKEAAKYVLWAASNSDMPIETADMRKIAQIAGVGVGERSEIEYELEKRATLNPFSGPDKDSFWEFVNETKKMSDDEFYKEANLNRLCDTLESIDRLYDNQHKYGSTLRYPEEICFCQNLDDLIKEASDLALIPSVDATISKKALWKVSDKANKFLSEYFGQKEALDGEDLVSKVASLDEKAANALLDYLV